jgi:hypothetical protein
MTDEKKNEIAKLTEGLSGEVKEVINKWLLKNTHISSAEAMQVVYQVVAYNLGFVDKVCSYLGMEDTSRLNLMDYFMKWGIDTAKEYLEQRFPEAAAAAKDANLQPNTKPAKEFLN